MAGIAKAEFVGPTNAQLNEQTSIDFNKTMLGMADFFANLTKAKQTQEAAKIKAQQEQSAVDTKNTQGILDTMVVNSATGSIAEVAKTPEGQAVIAKLYSGMGLSKDLLAPVISSLANNPYTADQIHKGVTSKLAGEQLQEAAQEAAQEAGGGGQAGGTAPAPVPATPSVPPGAPPLGSTGQVAATLAATPTPAVPVAPASPASAMPPYMQEALGSAPEAAPPAGQEQTPPPPEAKQAVQADARAQAKVISQEAGPSAAAIYLRKELDPNGIPFLTKYMAANPSEYYKDTDPKHVEAFQAKLDETLATRRKLGLESDELSINLQTLSEKNKTGITYTKALTLQALMAASTAQVNAKLASAAYQTNTAVLTKFLANAQDREDEANKMYAAVTAKGAKATVADVAHLNSLVEQANSYYKQANRVVTTMHVSLGGNAKEAPQFSDVPSYIMDKNGGLVGGFANTVTGFMQGEGSQTGQVVRGAQGVPPTASGPAAGVGAPGQTRAGATATSGGRVPSGYTPEQQKMADDILKELGQ